MPGLDERVVPGDDVKRPAIDVVVAGLGTVGIVVGPDVQRPRRDLGGRMCMAAGTHISCAAAPRAIRPVTASVAVEEIASGADRGGVGVIVQGRSRVRGQRRVGGEISTFCPVQRVGVNSSQT